MKKVIWLFAFLFYGFIFSQEEDPIEVPKIVVKIPLGETVRLDDVALTFVKVLEDSRCPKNVTCIWQGRIIVQVAVKREGDLIQNKELLMGKTKNGEQGTMLIDAIYASSVGFKGESLVEIEMLSTARNNDDPENKLNFKTAYFENDIYSITQ